MYNYKRAATHMLYSTDHKTLVIWCKAPRFYGLPKIHKPNIPLRPIVSAIGSPTYSLAKFVTSIIFPLAGMTPSHVKNTKHFTGMISEEAVNEDEVMVGFDVQSLLTNAMFL